MIELPPGKTAWPLHYHHANEEAIYLLEGEATLRLGDERIRVQAGDYIALPAGPDDAHQLTNTGAAVVRYLVISTMTKPDVCVYPDSNKVGVVGALTDDEGRVRPVVTFPASADVDYWDGETTSLGDDEPTPVDPQVREREIQQQVEDDLQTLKEKLAREGSGAADPQRPKGNETTSRASPRAETDAPSTDGDDDLDALKQRLAREAAAASEPPSSSSAAVDPDSLDDLDALKRSLDAD